MIKVAYEDHMGSDLDVVNAARVSYGKRDEKLSEKGQGLIQFLARGMRRQDYDDLVETALDCGRRSLEDHNGAGLEMHQLLTGFRNTPLHRSPTNQCYMKVHCRAPVFVARHLVKHEYLPWNEISGRYVTFENDLFMPSAFRVKADDKKQGSGLPLSSHAYEICQDIVLEAHEAAYRAYEDLLSRGVCEEQARGVLPLNLMTEWIWSGSLGAFAKMCGQRLRDDVQDETREVARQIDKIASGLFPVSWGALVHGKY